MANLCDCARIQQSNTPTYYKETTVKTVGLTKKKSDLIMSHVGVLY